MRPDERPNETRWDVLRSEEEVWGQKSIRRGQKRKNENHNHKESLLNHSLSLLENDKGFYDKNSWEQIVTYVQELPKWFRSTIKFLKDFKNWKELFSVDSVLIWWWEILTEETPFSYRYWLLSVWPFLFNKSLYLSGWIQIPKRIRNKIPFWILTKKAKKIYVRDYELFDILDESNSLRKKIKFFPDTSLFVIWFLWLDNDAKWYNFYKNIDLENFKWLINFDEEKIVDTDKNWYLTEIDSKKIETSFIVVNLNKKAEKFYDEIHKKVDEYYRQNYEVYFVPVCKSPTDMDIVYYHKLKEKFPAIKLLDWENWYDFINKLSKAKKVFTTRLHLFLIAYYLNCDVEPFVYQKKVEKMKKVLQRPWELRYENID